MYNALREVSQYGHHLSTVRVVSMGPYAVRVVSMCPYAVVVPKRILCNESSLYLAPMQWE